MMIWKLLATVLSAFTLIFASPLLVSFIDMFYWFWTNTTWTGLKYSDTEGGIRLAVMFMLMIPALICGTAASIIFGALAEQKKLEELREKIDRNKENE
jgi:uncharacterized membrane protein (DUF106 family)